MLKTKSNARNKAVKEHGLWPHEVCYLAMKSLSFGN